MRRFISFVMCIVLVLGCSRAERDIPCQTVTFSIGSISCGQMDTKATVTEFLRGIPVYSYPTLTVTSTTNTSYSIEVECGERVTLPEGTYNVTASYRKSVIGSVGGYSVAEEPIYEVNEEVVVTLGKVSYFLTGQYTCWALVINYVDTDHYMMDGNTFNMVKGDENRKGVLFISTTEPGMPWTLVAYPKDAVNYNAATFTVGENVAGYWYCYSPTLRDTQEGVFNINLADWQEGM